MKINKTITMKINKTITMESNDIFDSIRDYLQKHLNIQPTDVCSFTLLPQEKGESFKDTISVTIRQEEIKAGD